MKIMAVINIDEELEEIKNKDVILNVINYLKHNKQELFKEIKKDIHSLEIDYQNDAIYIDISMVVEGEKNFKEAVMFDKNDVILVPELTETAKNETKIDKPLPTVDIMKLIEKSEHFEYLVPNGDWTKFKYLKKQVMKKKEKNNISNIKAHFGGGDTTHRKVQRFLEEEIFVGEHWKFSFTESEEDLSRLLETKKKKTFEIPKLTGVDEDEDLPF